jgi:hypothetical protein
MKKFLLLFFSLYILIGSSSVQAQTVYVTKTGKKYHTENCKYVQNGSSNISLESAIAKGYEPCKVCHPGSGETEKVSTSAPKSKSSPGTTGIRVGCICNDGTRSYATGRGACSHHGGVNHWLYN